MSKNAKKRMQKSEKDISAILSGAKDLHSLVLKEKQRASRWMTG